MNTISKTLLAVLVGVLVGGAAYVMAAPADKTTSAAVPGATPAAAMTTVDLRGPCDEAEHANDPRCAGPQQAEDNNGRGGLDDGPNHDVGDDHGGLRHEAEPGDDNGNRGPGSRNSGPGSSHSDDGPNHDVGDDHGGNGADDGPSHDAGDDHGGSSSSGSGSSGSDSSGSGSSGSSHSGGSDD